MDSRNDAYFTNLLHQDSSLNDQIILESPDSITEYFNQHVEISTETSQFSTEKKPTSKKAQRGSSFSVDEDKLLVSAWLNISLDAVQANEQKQIAFWRRVHAYFHTYKNFNCDHTQISLSHRWSVI